jgi:hypothetical protein
MFRSFCTCRNVDDEWEQRLQRYARAQGRTEEQEWHRAGAFVAKSERGDAPSTHSAPTFDVADVEDRLNSFVGAAAGAGGALPQEGFGFDVTHLQRLLGQLDASTKVEGGGAIGTQGNGVCGMSPNAGSSGDTSAGEWGDDVSQDSECDLDGDSAASHASSSSGAADAVCNEDVRDFDDAYTQAMQEQLASYTNAGGVDVQHGGQSFGGFGCDAPKDVLRSIVAEAGQPGAASGLLRSLGMSIPENLDV